MSINVYIPPEMREILHGRKNVEMKFKIGDFLNDSFFKNYTKFKDASEFIEYSPYTDEELTANLKLFESNKMNRYIELTTQFKDYASMIGFAVREKLKQYFKKEE